jgi:hypothetical protein
MDFDLVKKRDLGRLGPDGKSLINWNNHFMLTYRHKPTYACFNVDKLEDMTPEERLRLANEVFDWLYD